jgi:hypothetical protein
MQGRAPGRRTKVSKGPGAVVRSLVERGQFAKGPRNGSDRTRQRPTKKVETAPGAAPVEVRHVAKAEDPREGTEADDRVLTLLVGFFTPYARRPSIFAGSQKFRLSSELSPNFGDGRAG